MIIWPVEVKLTKNVGELVMAWGMSEINSICFLFGVIIFCPFHIVGNLPK